MRVVGGGLKGQKLIAPSGPDTRPTTDRVRESLFNILAHGIDFNFDGARVIDLFAGSGALGIEAMSRGAAFCLFVEQAAPAKAAIRANCNVLGLTDAVQLHRRSAICLGELPTSLNGPFDLAFLDAPYGQGLTTPALTELGQGGWLKPDALCVVEQNKKMPPALPSGFEELDRRQFGQTQIGFLRVIE